MNNGQEKDHYSLNYKPKIEKIKNIIKQWEKRYLTLKGKVIVCNTLLIPQIMYLCSIIHTPTTVLKEIKQLITNFIWSNKKSLIKYETLCNDYRTGELNLTNIEIKNIALKLNWIKRLTNSNGSWAAYPNLISRKYNLCIKDLFLSRLKEIKSHSTF